jgi:hypothetical protein
LSLIAELQIPSLHVKRGKRQSYIPAAHFGGMDLTASIVETEIFGLESVTCTPN